MNLLFLKENQEIRGGFCFCRGASSQTTCIVNNWKWMIHCCFCCC